MKIRKEINIFNKKIKVSNIKINKEVKNIKKSFVANETISYSNYIRMSNRCLFTQLNFSSGINSNIKSWIPKSNIKKNMAIYKDTKDVVNGLLGFSGSLSIAFLSEAAIYAVGTVVNKSIPVVKSTLSKLKDIDFLSSLHNDGFRPTLG